MQFGKMYEKHHKKHTMLNHCKLGRHLSLKELEIGHHKKHGIDHGKMCKMDKLHGWNRHMKHEMNQRYMQCMDHPKMHRKDHHSISGMVHAHKMHLHHRRGHDHHSMHGACNPENAHEMSHNNYSVLPIIRCFDMAQIEKDGFKCKWQQLSKGMERKNTSRNMRSGEIRITSAGSASEDETLPGARRKGISEEEIGNSVEREGLLKWKTNKETKLFMKSIAEQMKGLSTETLDQAKQKILQVIKEIQQGATQKPSTSENSQQQESESM